MKHVFRVGFFILIPLTFLISQTAYSEPGNHHPNPLKQASRAPASLQAPHIRLSAFSPLDDTQGFRIKRAGPARFVSDMRPSTPPIGAGIGVSAPVLRFR